MPFALAPLKAVSFNTAIGTCTMKRNARILAIGTLIIGILGMAMSFIYLASVSMADITAGTSGFIAGSVLSAGGVVAIAILSANE